MFQVFSECFDVDMTVLLGNEFEKGRGTEGTNGIEFLFEVVDCFLAVDELFEEVKEISRDFALHFNELSEF